MNCPTKIHEKKTSIEELQTYTISRQFLYMSNIMVCNKNVLPDPEGPKSIERTGDVPITGYLLCLTLYYLMMIRSILTARMYIYIFMTRSDNAYSA